VIGRLIVRWRQPKNKFMRAVIILPQSQSSSDEPTMD
jgi:hypothetical protein